MQQFWWLRCPFSAAVRRNGYLTDGLPVLQRAASNGLLQAYSNYTQSPSRRRYIHCSLLTARARSLHTTADGSEPAVREGPKKARDPETWAVGCSLVADADALTRQLGEGLASIFPTHPDAPASMLRGDAVFDRLHVCYNRVNGQDGLCFGQPASSPPCTNPLTEHCGH